MKKSLIVINILLIIVIIVIAVKVKYFQAHQREIANFNSAYEEYNKEDLNGLDITTIINKAINNNEKYEISKDENGLYILDDEYSIEIYVTMIINNKTYRMERFNQDVINDFIRYFGEVGFKCTDVQYHEKSGRISSMTFEATIY